MLPWNPPSSFNQPQSSDQGGNNQPHFSRPLYNQDNRHQPEPPNHNNNQNNQQQQQGQQGQAPNQPNAPPAPPPITLSSTLHFLQSEHRRYAKDRNEWEIERAEMRARIALLEGEKRGNEGALRDLGRRCRMLEVALRGERSKFLSTTNALNTAGPGHTPSASGTSSPIPSGTVPLPATTKAALGLNPKKDAEIAPIGDKDKEKAASGSPESAAMTASVSTPGIAAPSTAGTPGLTGAPSVTVHPAHGSAVPSRPLSQLGLNGNTLGGAGNTGTWGGLGGGATLGGGGRDPRGKARSRDYLKQCLQEITYLTSSTTLNPLGPTSYGAPGVARPRKVLPDNLPPPVAAGEAGKGNVPGLISLPGGLAGMTASSGEAPSATAAAPVTTPAPTASAPAPQAKQLAEFKPASVGPAGDAASAFVPLKRTISQPGQQGGRGRSEREEVPAAEEGAQVEEKAEEVGTEGGVEPAKEAEEQAKETFAEVVKHEAVEEAGKEEGKVEEGEKKE